MADHVFICYSDSDALDFTRQLADELEGGEDKYVDAWWDKRDIDPGRDWDDQIVDAIRSCKCMLFILTADSTAQGSPCKNEWTWALKYKKPVVPIRLQREVEQPFGLGNRQWIDFMGEFEAGLAKLRKFLRHMETPEGQLDALKDRLADANRDFRRARAEDKPRIQKEVDELNEQINTLQKIVDNPQAAEEQTKKNIETGLERERQPEKPVTAKIITKIINPPPAIAPNYFQDRVVETKQIVDFLNNDSQRLMTIVGRGGVGKTAMVCRLLKGLEGGSLPDGLGEMQREGIVYLSESGSYHVNFANIFYGLSQLLPTGSMQELDAVYKNPQTSTESKMNALLAKFSGGRVVLLLDNFEPLVDVETFAIRDTELDESLRAFLKGAHTSVKILITTRIAPQKLNLFQPGRQRPPLILDEGLESPYAENILKEMDKDGLVGLKSATDDLRSRARERTRGYPRALEALFAILASDRYTTLAELLAKPTPENVVEELVGEAFNRLDTNAQKVMQALAVYNRPVTPAAVDYLLQPHLPAMDSAPILKRLVNMHFARRFEGERFYLHPVDREFAYDTIPEGEKSLETLEESDFPFDDIEFDELSENNDLLHEEDDEWLDADNEEGFDKELTEFDRNELIENLTVSRTDFTRYGLLDRAADYFVKVRKPREEWKKLDDLAAQLAEFDLRCVAGDYDTAASVLLEIDFDYLLLWGHYRSTLELYNKIYKSINDKFLHRSIVGNMGATYSYMAEYSNALLFHTEALDLARESNDREGEAIWVNWIANSLSDLGKTQEAIDQYELSLKLAKEVGSKADEGIALNNLGNRFAELGDAHQAIKYYEQALVIARESSDKRNEGIYLGNLGNRYADLGNAQKAMECYERSLTIAREISNRSSEGDQLSNLGNTYANLGDASKAIRLNEQALAIAREIGDRSREGLWVGNLGTVYQNLGEVRKAIEFYEQALAIAREISNRSREGLWVGNLGSAYQNLGEVRKAIEFYEQALAIAREVSNRSSEGLWLGNLGSAYQNLGEVRKAIEFYEQALAIDREIGDRGGEGSNLGSLGSAYQNLGEVRKAIEFYEQALTIARETSDRRNEGVWLGNLGSAYQNLGEVRKAIEFYEQALTIARETSDRRNEGVWLGNLGSAYSDLAEVSKALELHIEALAVIMKIGSPATYEYEALSEAYLANGQLEDALINAKEAQNFDQPQNNHNISTLLGIIALRRLEVNTARPAFMRAIKQADEILVKTPEYYSALDAKGLALCGLAICDDKKYVGDAIETFRTARKIAPHAGVVKSLLRLFDELVKCDEEGILKDVKKVVEGKE